MVRSGSGLARQLPRGVFELEAEDQAGNRSRWQVPVSVIPRQPVQLVRAVHVTSYGWADASIRQGVLDLVDEEKINAIEPRSQGRVSSVGWDAAVPYWRAHRRG